MSYPAEFRQVTADTRRMEQIARAGGGHVLDAPGGCLRQRPGADHHAVAAAADRCSLIAAVLLPIEVGLRRLRVSPADVARMAASPAAVGDRRAVARSGRKWRPRRLDARRTGPDDECRPRVRGRCYTERHTLAGHATPGLARQTDPEDADEDDALGATLKWLAARRGNTRGDSG